MIGKTDLVGLKSSLCVVGCLRITRSLSNFGRRLGCFDVRSKQPIKKLSRNDAVYSFVIEIVVVSIANRMRSSRHLNLEA